MEELVWRKEGERCERSYRREQAPQTQVAQHTQQQVAQHTQQQVAQHTQAPYTFINRHEVEGFRQNNNKREQANNKINERFLIGKSSQNPFMTSNSYNDDIEVQMNFLTPQKGDI
jgi:glutaredoxin